ncbi:right-handed parallel beta-helix repeat-containing protein [Micromonospora siamensis]|uniref:Right handed beta helix region n=1 Tax=Micromonospora siamensis TaxID=299152 RepID=A0A1C5GYY4_9ACTN|nr:right-handed parallel beta-helix repeat-containing protein [Micromonospora siamensis]SCG39029.1 Right handed beta helix region [Micromonospora siamensis]
MRRSPLAGLTAFAVAGGTLLTGPPAYAAASYRYVAQNSASCSDTGPGTQEQPYCTIGAAAAAATAGTVVRIGSGTYRERVTVPRSGTPDLPITFEATGAGADRPWLAGATAGFVVDGQHDIVLRNVQVREATTGAVLDVRNASTVLLDGVRVEVPYRSAAQGIRLAGASGVTVRQSYLATHLAAVTMDAATRGVTVASSRFWGQNTDTGTGTGVEVAGSGVTVAGNEFHNWSEAAVATGSGAARAVVVNNAIEGWSGRGVVDRATGTMISNNDVVTYCADGIRIEGTSTGASVQNNVVRRAYAQQGIACDGPGVAITVLGAARPVTTVDYNNTYANGPTYSWDHTTMDLATFRGVSGQAAHDRHTQRPVDRQDSANSAAPGYPATDQIGQARADNPNVPNSGTGPVTYADRGPVETIVRPQAELGLALDLGTLAVTADAAASTPGWFPLASYRFDFGDGTVVTQSSPKATHRYADPGTYRVAVRVAGTDGSTAETARSVSVLRRVGTVGLLARSNLRYVAPLLDQSLGLRADHYGVDSVDKFDVADTGNGAVALFSRSRQRYVSADDNGNGRVLADDLAATGARRLTLIRNRDGSTSVRTSSGRYLSTSGSGGTLQAAGTTISRFEQFHLVDVANANRTLKARANGRYVTASSTAATPLIASATGVGVAQRFDLVELSNGNYGVFARANNRFVTAASLGTKPLVNTVVVPGRWEERFNFVRNRDGSTSIQSAVNGRFVTADDAGAGPLIARAVNITSWEQYTLG